MIPLTAYDANAVGYVLTMWLPLAMLTAALWSLRAQRWQGLKRLTACASWPLWALGLVLLAFSEQLAQRGVKNFPPLSIERLQQAQDTLTGARWLLLGVGCVTLLVLLKQRRHLPAMTLRGWSVGVFVVGAALFAATRSMAHDAQLVYAFNYETAFGRQIPATASLPPNETCNRPKTTDAVQLEISADRALLDGSLASTTDDASELLDRKVELWRTFNPGRPLSLAVQISTHPETPTERRAAFDQMLKALLERHPAIHIEHLFINPLPTIEPRTLDHPIERAELCVMPFQP